MPDSTSGMLTDKLTAKENQITKINTELEEYKMKVEALSSAELKESRKRARMDIHRGKASGF